MIQLAMETLVWHDLFLQSLIKDFDSLKSKNPRYSLRAHAKRLGLSPSGLSAILRHKMVLTKKRALKVMPRLGLAPEEKNLLLAMMGEPPSSRRRNLPVEDYEILTDWAYLAVLNLLQLENIDHSSTALAKRLGLPEKKVAEIMNRLETRGLITRSDEGKIVAEVNWSTTDGVSHHAIRKHHHENLQVAIRALAEVPMEKRDFTSLTFPANQEKLDLLRKEIRQFYDRITALTEADRPYNEIYRVSICLFPFNFEKDTEA